MSLTEWLTGFAGASPIEWIATVAGFICVFLVIKRNIWCFFFGLIQVTLYTWIFYGVKLYSDMTLQLFYVGFQIYGWWIWSRSYNNEGELVIVSSSRNEISSIILLIIAASALLGFSMDTYTDASFAYADAFTTCASLVAQWLLSHKRIINWVIWIIVDVVAIYIYWQKELFPTALLFFCFLIMSSYGLYQWYRCFQRQNNAFAT